MITVDEVSNALISAGGKEFSNKPSGGYARAFVFKNWLDLPKCECNDRPPDIHVYVWGEIFKYPGNVVFEIVGQFQSQWVKIEIYSVEREKALELLPRLKSTLARMWAAYCGGMGP